VTDFSPRAIYTSGKASTAAGLTAAVVKVTIVLRNLLLRPKSIETCKIFFINVRKFKSSTLAAIQTYDPNAETITT
jgi:hypothetical protein